MNWSSKSAKAFTKKFRCSEHRCPSQKARHTLDMIILNSANQSGTVQLLFVRVTMPPPRFTRCSDSIGSRPAAPILSGESGIGSRSNPHFLSASRQTCPSEVADSLPGQAIGRIWPAINVHSGRPRVAGSGALSPVCAHGRGGVMTRTRPTRHPLRQFSRRTGRAYRSFVTWWPPATRTSEPSPPSILVDRAAQFAEIAWGMPR